MLARGEASARGTGVKQNLEEAVEWHTKGAEAGDADCMINLGVCYANGVEGVVAEDREEAIKWFRKADELGHALAKGQLERLRAK